MAAAAELASMAELAEAQGQLAAVQEALNVNPADEGLLSLVENLQQLVGLLESEIPSSLNASHLAPTRQAATSAPVAPLQLQPHEEAYRDFFANEDTSIVSGALHDIQQRSYHRLRWGEAIRPEVECLAPLPSADGQGQDYHQVVVVKLDAATQTCLVVFTRPMIPSMIPCRSFLRNACSKPPGTCCHHHGMTIATSELRPFRTSPIDADSRCFYTTPSNSCWQRGTVYGLVDDLYAIVMPRGGHSEPLTLALKLVAPLPELRNEGDDSSDNSDSNDDSEDDADIEAAYNAALAPDSYAHSAAFGTWETHTKGFGSKLMAKLGYVAGQGLGKDKQGRVEPVQALMVPQGKSLDYIMTQRVQGRLRNVGEKPIRAAKVKTKRHTVFDTINAATKHAGITAEAQPTAKRIKHQSVTDVKASRADLLSLQLQIDELERQKAAKAAQTALSARHAQHQAAQLNYGVSTIDEEIKELKKQQRRLQTAVDKHKTRSKLKVF